MRAEGFEPSTSWSRTSAQNHIRRCPGVTYWFSGRSLMDKSGQATAKSPSGGENLRELIRKPLDPNPSVNSRGEQKSKRPIWCRLRQIRSHSYLFSCTQTCTQASERRTFICRERANDGSRPEESNRNPASREYRGRNDRQRHFQRRSASRRRVAPKCEKIYDSLDKNFGVLSLPRLQP